MAEELKGALDGEDKKSLSEDNLKIATAVNEIKASPTLRFFLRDLLQMCGATSTPIAEDPYMTYRLLGRHEIGVYLIARLTDHDPMLWPALLLEDANERKEKLE